MTSFQTRLMVAFTGVALVSPAVAAPPADPDARATRSLRQMTQDEKLGLLLGLLTPRVPEKDRPAGITVGAGYVPGVPRLGVPVLVESDASLGVANMGGFMRRNDGATAMPSGLAMGSTFNPDLIEEAGRAMGAETRAKGFNVLLAGGVNLVREPRNGRNFEYFAEDPLLSGVLGGRSVKGIQSNHIVSTLKHYALNAQETGRTFADVRMAEGPMRESDLLAFQIATEIGDPGSYMCSYNKVNGAWACENDFLLNDVLRRDWGFKGWVMSDWGAVHSLSIGKGLDQESGTKPADATFFGKPLRDAVASGRVPQAQVDQSVHRILRTVYALGLAADPVAAKSEPDHAAGARIAQTVAEQGIVLLKNEGDILPIAATARRILLVGGHADKGVPQGGGSSQVWPVGGASLSLPIPGDKPYHRRLYMPSAPLDALKEMRPDAAISFDDGSDPARAARAARDADMVIVFGEQFMAENYDVATLDLPENQNALIDAVASANPKTVVVLETGGPVAMPWLAKVPAVIEAWYAGQRGGHAIARVLTGAVNPSGRLPVTFPASLAQTPNPVLPGQELIDAAKGKDLYDLPTAQQQMTITYPEGSDVGYRWYAARDAKPLFAFGHGLSYTRFETSALRISDTNARFTVKNTGKRAGAAVVQLYLVSRGGKASRRLVGFQRIELQPGEAKEGGMTIDRRLLADWRQGKWTMPGGGYAFATGQNAMTLGERTEATFKARSWKDGK